MSNTIMFVFWVIWVRRSGNVFNMLCGGSGGGDSSSVLSVHVLEYLVAVFYFLTEHFSWLPGSLTKTTVFHK